MSANLTYQTLADAHGVLLDYEVLARVMKRSPDGLRLSLSRGSSDWAKAINQAKVKIGRRVLFRTELIAQLIDRGPEVGISPVTDPASSPSQRQRRAR